MRTRRLVLREFEPSDVDNLVTLDGDPEVMRFLTGEASSRTEIETGVLPRFLAAHAKHRRFGFWAAETSGDGVFVGWFGLHPVTPDDSAIVMWTESDDTAVVEIGYRIRRSAWGQGYATEGVQALVRRAFTDLAVREIVGTTMAVNVGSRRVMEKVRTAVRAHLAP